jgi:hypothetical protein
MTKWTKKRLALKEETMLLLKDLGADVQSVATALGAAGVRGRRGSSSDCPVARYLNAIMGADRRVDRLRVGLAGVMIHRDRWWSPPVVVPIPKPVKGFIMAFDRGEMPELAVQPARAITTTEAA